MTNEELCKRLRLLNEVDAYAAADRIEALVRDRNGWREEAMHEAGVVVATEANLTKALAALREISAEASVPVEAKKHGGISHKKLYKGWRKIATERIDIARTTLAVIGGEG